MVKLKKHLVRVHILVEVEAYVNIRAPKNRVLDQAKQYVAESLSLDNASDLADGYTYDICLHTDFDTDFEEE